ncbi:Arm DNA-binding domain-containing protein [Pseudogemmobacter faecipullorum]|uniref:Arm DNA-binding domain-containing protein n=1 Tax=Pseudogemmobacter faecipullorum TaxID=2755041 RepID=UPI001D019063|nr:Arm DNA-binding domain-containing protein [Pseudogemmobacter faecipullorum]
MAKLTKRVVDAAESRRSDYVIWDDELPGFGLRVFTSGKRSYVIQYRQGGRSRRYTIGLHGIWTPELARQEAKVQLGRIARGEPKFDSKSRKFGIRAFPRLYFSMSYCTSGSHSGGAML